MINFDNEIMLRRIDNKNIVIEKSYIAENKEGQSEMRWRVEGYYPSLRLALKSIIDNDLFLDWEKIDSVQKLQQEIQVSTERIIQKLEDAELDDI